MKIYNAETIHGKIEIDLTKEEKYLIYLELKELFNYCSENKLKYIADFNLHCLYMYSRRFPLFCGCHKLREDNYNVYTQCCAWRYDFHYDSFVVKKYRNIINIMGKERYKEFYNQLASEVSRLFI
ncbi:MAG: hypothetical protein CL760_01815 [Chloroflexi bacterium]|nr:hypothetical protein [Chloroflexota bacterium]|tara:strand:+ start:19526 stop:19900 length:375 start_codon:yes stop_codon:yes gene_type:complete